MREIWLIRHGESMANAGHVVPVNSEALLTDKGHAQAQDLSLKIKTAPDVIMATAYIRTQQTAQPTRNRFPAAPFEIANLHEFNVLSTKVYAETSVDQRYPLADEYWKKGDPDFIHGEGAESFSSALTRVRNEFSRIAQRPEPFTTLFTHGRIMHLARLMLLYPDRSTQDLMAAMPVSANLAHVHNCEILRVVQDGGRLALHAEDAAAFARKIQGRQL